MFKVTVTLLDGTEETFADPALRGDARWAHAYRYKIKKKSGEIFIYRRDVWQGNLGWNEEQNGTDWRWPTSSPTAGTESGASDARGH